MKRNKIMRIGAAAALGVIAISTTATMAASTTIANSSQPSNTSTNRNRDTNRTPPTAAEVAARQAEMKAHLAADVASGKITQVEADQRLADMANHKKGNGGFGKNGTVEQKSEREQKMASHLASVLGTTQSDILAKLSAGSSPRDIITASGKDITAVEAQLDTLRQADMKARLAADVVSGKITQAEADRISTDMANHKGGPGAEGRGGRDNINKITHNKPVTK